MVLFMNGDILLIESSWFLFPKEPVYHLKRRCDMQTLSRAKGCQGEHPSKSNSKTIVPRDIVALSLGAPPSSIEDSRMLRLTIPVREFSIDRDKKILKSNGQIIPLGCKAFSLLEILVLAKGKTVKHGDLISALGKKNGGSSSCARITAIVSRMREKFRHSECPQIIENVHGCGYRLNASITVE